MKDLLRVYQGFETLDAYVNKDKVINTLVELVMEFSSFEDEALLEIMMNFHEKGILEKQQDLAVKLRVYCQERFDFMDRNTMLGYLEFFNKIGMYFEDKEAMLLIKDSLNKAFHMYELPELFKAYKLTAHNFYRD
jgi:hypothetical protein